MGYLHGYTETEQQRLVTQARFLENKIFESLDLSDVRRLLEVGCGTGAECELLLRRFPKLTVTAVDNSQPQLSRAQDHLRQFPELEGRYELIHADASNLAGLRQEPFDAAFFCWVLEHVSNPVAILAEVRKVLAPQGRIFLTEVFNHTLCVEPPVRSLDHYWACYNQLQRILGGDPDVGLKLGRHLHDAGFRSIQVWPKFFLFDARDPGGRDRMMAYWLELILSARDQLLEQNLLTTDEVKQLVQDWNSAQQRPDTIFFYHFMQALAVR